LYNTFTLSHTSVPIGMSLSYKISIIASLLQIKKFWEVLCATDCLPTYRLHVIC